MNLFYFFRDITSTVQNYWRALTEKHLHLKCDKVNVN